MKLPHFFSRSISGALITICGFLVFIPAGETTAQQGAGTPDSVLTRTPGLADYALLQRAQSLTENERLDEAERTFRQVARQYPTSLLSREASLQSARLAFQRSAYRQTLEDLDQLIEKSDGAALRLAADALLKMNRREDSLQRLRQIFFEAPQSAEAEGAAALFSELTGGRITGNAAQWRLRADKLYQSGIWIVAAQAYQELTRQYPEKLNDEIRLRSGISFYKGNSFQEATEALLAVRSKSQPIAGETLYYLAMSQLSLENEQAAIESLTTLRRIASGSSLEAEILYNLGRFHIKRERPAQAETWYTQLVERFPTAEMADEAHFWLAWQAHQAQDYARAAQLLTDHLARYAETTENRGRAGFWAAMDHERSGNRARALTLYRGMLMRYGAGWYGINAERRIAKLANQGIEGASINSDPLLRRAITGLQNIRHPKETLRETDRERISKAEQLIRLNMLQAAMNELEVARANSPDSPIINLRIAQILRKNGDPVGAINALKRSYPDYGQSLPDEMTREAWEIFYPLNWWTEIREEARRHKLDPYLIAGIIRQETVFNPKARSRANALGLMQLLPSTGQAVAKKNSLGGGRISQADLFNPVINIQLGTAYIRELFDRFGRFEYVAAAYNGGPTRVSRWLNQMPEKEIEDWVEGIPISETRLYVQGVYRNSRQYQRLYDEKGNFRDVVPR